MKPDKKRQSQQAATYDTAVQGSHARALYPHLLEELSREQQVLLFTCQTREGAALGDAPGLTRLVL